MKPGCRLIVIGYGNPGRLDDGLGPAFAERVAKLGLPGVTADSNYQLNVEDAATIAEYDMVVFADASVSGPEPFSWCDVAPREPGSFSSHHVEPGEVVQLARTLFGAQTKACLLGIRGYEFNEFCERLSDGAQANLDEALAFFQAAAEDDWAFEARPCSE